MRRWRQGSLATGPLLVGAGLLARLGSVAAQYRYHLNPALDHWRYGWEMGRVARSLVEGRGFASPMYEPSGPTAWVAPLYPLLVAAASKLFGLYTAGAVWTILGMNALFGALTVLPVRALARRLAESPESGNAAMERRCQPLALGNAATERRCRPQALGNAATECRCRPQALGNAATECRCRSQALGNAASEGRLGPQLSGWYWALLPYGIYLAGERIWENTLTTLLAATLLWLTYELEERDETWRWLLYGGLWGAAALASPALLSVLPSWGLWIAWRRRRGGGPWPRRAVAAGLIFLALLGPWTIRNHRVLGRWIPLRDNFWLEMHVGNNGDERQPCPDAVHPSNSAREREQWTRLGELGYMDAKKVEAKAWIAAHPGQFARLSLRRALFVWTGFWSFDREYREGEPMALWAAAYFSAMTALAGLGVVLAWRRGFGARLWPMLWMFAIFPLPYYITHPSYDYRHPMDPALVVLGGYALAAWWSRRRIHGELRESGSAAPLGADAHSGERF